MSTFISIGTACNVKYQINKINNSKETLFFDWLMVDMQSVISILKNHEQIDNIINIHTVVKDEKNPINGNNSRIIINSLSFCVSIHDLPIEYNNTDIEEFISKYKRRLDRIIKLIKSDSPIYFLRYSDINNDTVNEFISTINNINPNCNFKLVCIHVDKDNIDSLTKSDNFIKFTIKKPDLFDTSDWTTSYIDWNYIFTQMQNNH